MAISVLNSTFNAFAFAGAGWIFSKINHSDYSVEMKRHNLALEKMTKARDRWNQARMIELDRVNNLRYAKDQAEDDLDITNEDFDDVHTKFDTVYQVKQHFEHTRPQLKDYYRPSDEMNNYMNLVKLATAVPAIYGIVSLL